MKFEVAEKVLYILMRSCVPTMLCGVHGIGKTSMLMQMARRRREELGQDKDGIGLTASKMKFGNQNGMFGFWALDVSITDKDELIGYGNPILLKKIAFEQACRMCGIDQIERIPEVAEKIFRQAQKHWDTEEDSVMEYIRAGNFLPPAHHKGGGIWMPDELNRDKTNIKTAICQIALTGRFMDYVMPEGIWSCTSINPPGEDYAVSEFDGAEISRWAFVPVQSSIDGWTQFAIDNRFNEDLVQFVNERKNEVFNKHDNLSYNPDVDSTSRAIGYQQDVLNFLATEDGNNLDIYGADNKDALMNLFNAIWGTKAGVFAYQFFTSTRDLKVLKAEDIIHGYGWESGSDGKSWASHYQNKQSKVRMQVLKMMAADKAGEQIGEGHKEIRVDLLGQTLGYCARWVDEKIEGLGRSAPDAETSAQFANLLLFLHDVPKDLARRLMTSDKWKKQLTFINTATRTAGAQKIMAELVIKTDHEVRHLKKEAA